MNGTGPRDTKKVKAAWAAMVPFLLAEAAILVVEFGGFELDKSFFGIVFGINVVLAIIIFGVVMGSRRRR